MPKDKKNCEYDHIIAALDYMWLNKDYFDEVFNHINTKITRVEVQTTKTNGRVTKLEEARERMLWRRQALKTIWTIIAWIMWAWVPFIYWIWFLVDKLK